MANPSGPPTAFDAVTVSGVPTMGMAGLPLATGNFYFVDAVNGSDGQTGAADQPLQTIGAAYAKMVDGNNDVCVIVGDGSTTATQRLSATLTWAKDACHLIGMTAPTPFASRARISTATGATTNINPLVEVTAQGCIFANFSLYQGVGQAATAEQLWLEEGQRNAYYYVHFGGMGSAVGSDQATSYSLKLYGGGERYFKNCVVGLDTQTRGAANANLLVRANASAVAATRDLFEDCFFPMYADASTPYFIDTGAVGAIDRFIWFKNCAFHNAVFGGPAGTSIAAVVNHNASQGGAVVMDNCSVVGATDYTASDTSVVQILGPVPNGDTSGMSVDANTT